MSSETKKGINRGAFYATIAVLFVVIGVLAVFVFLRGGWQPASKTEPEPEITDITIGWDDHGTTYILYVSVKNNGASGNVQVFAEVKAIQSLNVGFAQTQDKIVYLNKGGATTITFTFHSDWLAVSNVSRNVWAIVP